VSFDCFIPDTHDFRTILSKVKISGAQALYIGVQSPDSMLIILKQLKELNVNLQLFGNEIAGQTSTEAGSISERLIFSEPELNEENSKTAFFLKEYKKKYNLEYVSFARQAAEAYDAVMLMSEAIRSVGENPQEIKAFLEHVDNFQGASGIISFHGGHDGSVPYVLKEIEKGRVKKIM